MMSQHRVLHLQLLDFGPASRCARVLAGRADRQAGRCGASPTRRGRATQPRRATSGTRASGSLRDRRQREPRPIGCAALNAIRSQIAQTGARSSRKGIIRMDVRYVRQSTRLYRKSTSSRRRDRRSGDERKRVEDVTELRDVEPVGVRRARLQPCSRMRVRRFREQRRAERASSANVAENRAPASAPVSRSTIES